MKQLWNILMEKVKQIEPNAAALGIGIMGLLAMIMTTRIIIMFFKMIVEIVNAFVGQPVG